MSPGGSSATDELEQVLKKLEVYQKETGVLSPYYRDLLEWTKNVDKRYAWVALVALWLIMASTLGPYRIYALLFAKVTADGVYTREEASWPVSMIFTVENCVGPVVSILVYYMSHRKSLMIGSILLSAGNGFAYLSNSLILDVALIGVVQGIGYAFIFMPFLEIINNYFLRYRNLAFGLALTGGTVSMFGFIPIFQWLLDNYPWRCSYLGICLVCSINLIMIPLLRPNPRPKVNIPSNITAARPIERTRKISQISQLSFKALRYRNSMRSQNTIMISRQQSRSAGITRQSSIISVNPFANSVGLERKISRTISNEIRPEAKIAEKTSPMTPTDKPTDVPSEDRYESISLNEMGKEINENDFRISMVLELLKVPSFHLIWYNELIYFWIFSIYSLILVDYGVDRGCSMEESESLINFQSVGELLGRIGLTYVVDLHLVSNRAAIIIILVIDASLLIAVTYANGYVTMAILTTSITAITSLLYILLNVLLVDSLGERRVTLGYGMASCICGFLLALRPTAVGFFKDYLQSYEYLLLCLAGSSALGALLWILEPSITKLFGPKQTQPDRNTNQAACQLDEKYHPQSEVEASCTKDGKGDDCSS